MYSYHKKLAKAELHPVLSWYFVDATDRNNVVGLDEEDIGKVAWDLDTDSYWILKDNVGPVWNLCGAPFGTTLGTICQGDDSRLSNARNSLPHPHGNISNSGLLGIVSDLPLITGPSGIIQTGSFGSGVNTFCQGNDPRLSDTRVPVLHNQDASTIISGTMDLARLPAGALDRLVIVEDQIARFALTTAIVQIGDTVKQLSPSGIMYRVVDDTKLGEENGYVEYTAQRASAIDWTGVENKPSTFAPNSHGHGNITNEGLVGTVADVPLITGAGGAVQAGSFGSTANTFCQGNDARLGGGGGLGVGQTWHDMVASRAIYTTYYNPSSTKPMMINIATVDSFQFVVGGIVAAYSPFASGVVFSVVVPPSASYRMPSASGITGWWELF